MMQKNRNELSIIDLDDTLFDCERLVKDLAKKEIEEKFGAQSAGNLRFFQGLHAKEKEDIVLKHIKNISLFPGVQEWLQNISSPKVLVTRGDIHRQELKIKTLKLEDSFDEIIITQDKHATFLELCTKYDMEAKNVVVYGDKQEDELHIAKELGFQARNVRPKVVSIGGGSGQPVLLEGIKHYAQDITAIVTVADDGGSSGRLRNDLNILPPGDIRNCLVALSQSEKLMHDLFQYRFQAGELQGHSFGNLFLAALSATTGSFEEAIAKTSYILEIKGQVLPSTLNDVTLCAKLSDGSVLKTEHAIGDDEHAAIEEIFLEPKAKTTPAVLDAIKDADIVVLGPGSLYTSILVNLLVEGVKEALQEKKIVYVCNIFTQASETKGFSAKTFLFEVEKYLGRKIDVVFVNTKRPPESELERYKKENKQFVEPDIVDSEVKGQKVIVVAQDFLREKNQVWEEQDWLHHDSIKLSYALLEYWREQL